MRSLRTAVIGAGRWGQNIIQTLRTMPEAELLYIENKDHRKLLAKKDIDAVIIATPGSTHARVALPFIARGLPVFIEKPMTTALADAKRLAAAARKSGSLVFIGHLHIYNPAYQKAKALTQTSGRIRFLYGEGCNNGPYREDMSALWDWAPHDLSMMLDLVGENPLSVQAWAISSLRPNTKLYDSTWIKLIFPGGTEGLVFSSWLSPEKKKRLTIIGEKNSLVFDDTAEQKVIFYENMGPTLKKIEDQTTVLFQSPKITYPEYAKDRPLLLELRAFFQNIISKKRPLTGLAEGIAVVAVLAAAEKSIAQHGQLVEFSP